MCFGKPPSGGGMGGLGGFGGRPQYGQPGYGQQGYGQPGECLLIKFLSFPCKYSSPSWRMGLSFVVG